MSNETCPQCHAELAEGQWMCPSCGTALNTSDVERTVARPLIEPQPSAPPPAAGLITGVPGVGGPPAAGAFAPPAWSPIPGTPAMTPPGQPLQPPAMSPSSTPITAAAPIGAPPKSSAQKWLPKVAVLLALVGIGVAAWAVLGSDDGDKATGAATTVVPLTTVPSSEVATTTTAATATSEAATTTVAPTTVAPTTVAPTTVAPTTVPAPTVPARPPWPAPAIPDPPIFAGPGLAYAISDPLRGGMPSDEPTPYLAFAQQVFDQMAMDDWAGALSHFYFQPAGGVAGPYTFDQQNQWSVADRLSLLLVDAAPSADGLGYDLQVAVVANFPGATSLLCGRLHSDPVNYGEVIQLGQMVLLADGEPPYMPETLLNDPARIADLQARCV